MLREERTEQKNTLLAQGTKDMVEKHSSCSGKEGAEKHTPSSKKEGSSREAPPLLKGGKKGFSLSTLPEDGTESFLAVLQASRTLKLKIKELQKMSHKERCPVKGGWSARDRRGRGAEVKETEATPGNPMHPRRQYS